MSKTKNEARPDFTFFNNDINKYLPFRNQSPFIETSDPLKKIKTMFNFYSETRKSGISSCYLAQPYEKERISFNSLFSDLASSEKWVVNIKLGIYKALLCLPTQPIQVIMKNQQANPKLSFAQVLDEIRKG